MTVLVDELYAQILAERSQESTNELSNVVSVMESNAQKDGDVARRQSPMLGVLKAAVASGSH